jgi:Zn-dependent M28 family amino/carboxypeptidase
LINFMDLADPELATAGVVQLAAIISPEHTSLLFEGSSISFDQVLAADRQDMPLPRGDLDGALEATIAIETSTVSSPNVIAVFPGSDAALGDEYVLLSAHLDHVGVGDPIDGDSIYNGTMDNASGVATLLEVARALRAGDVATRRSILLLACTGEEMGLLGSEYFAARPTVPMSNVVAAINLDMFLPIVPLRTVRGYGVGESDLAGYLEAAARDLGIEVQDDPQPERNIFIRSDQYSFIKRGVPALFLGVGYDMESADGETMTGWFARRYHAPSDDLDQPIDLESAAAFNRLMTALTLRVANADQRPAWKDDSFFRRIADTVRADQ